MALLQQPAQRRGNQLIKLILKIYLNSNSNLPYKDFAFDMCRKGLAATRALSETQKLIQLSSRLQQKREKVSEIYRQWITAQSLLHKYEHTFSALWAGSKRATLNISESGHADTSPRGIVWHL